MCLLTAKQSAQSAQTAIASEKGCKKSLFLSLNCSRGYATYLKCLDTYSRLWSGSGAWYFLGHPKSVLRVFHTYN